MVRCLRVAPGHLKRVSIHPSGVGGDLGDRRFLGLAPRNEAWWRAGKGGLPKMPGIQSTADLLSAAGKNPGE